MRTNTLIGTTFSTLALGGALALQLSASAQGVPPSVPGVMPAAQQNAIVKARCVLCHSEVQRKGGLSLEHFDAAHPDPSLARLMTVKITADNAMAAGGNPVPDRETVDAFVGALAAGIRRAAPVENGWTVDLIVDPSTPGRGHSFVTARAVQEVPLPRDAHATAGYELTLTCNGAVRRAGVELSTYTKAGPDAARAPRTPATAPALAWPLGTGGIRLADLFPDERVVFPVSTLSPAVRDIFSWCFAAAQ